MSQKITAVAIALLLALAWFFRFDFQIASAGGQGVAASGYMLNRWTGNIYFIAPTSIREIREPQPNVFDQFDKK